MSTVKSMHTYLVYALAIIFLIMGVFGYLDIKNSSDAGYSSNDFTVTKVEEGGPAAEAGMQVGDQIISIDNLDVRDTKAWSDKARTVFVDRTRFVVGNLPR